MRPVRRRTAASVAPFLTAIVVAGSLVIASPAFAASTDAPEDGPNVLVRVVPILVVGAITALVVTIVRRRRADAADRDA